LCLDGNIQLCSSYSIAAAAPRETKKDDLVLQSKEQLLDLHKKRVAAASASLKDKKQSLQMVASLTREINNIKKRRLDQLKISFAL
jgi:hypothetical protein